MTKEKKEGRILEVKDWKNIQEQFKLSLVVTALGIEVGERLGFVYKDGNEVKTKVYGIVIQKQPFDRVENSFIIKTEKFTFLWQPKQS